MEWRRIYTSLVGGVTALEPGGPGGKAALAQAPTGRVHFGQWCFLVLQLALLALVIRQFQLESGAFLRIALLGFAGALVHAWLPLPVRLPFFVALSGAGIALVFGLVNGAWLVGLGLVLIGLCHLPVPFAVRTACLLAAGGGLVLLRADWLSSPWSPAIWPIFGSMFMFRLIVYLYDLKHDKAPVSVWRTLAYFFLLPNVCFPLFPVVDFKTFRRNYYNEDAAKIYQIGVDWMVRGVLHLILYRVVYYYCTLSPSEVVTLGDLLRYLTTNFLLYFRVSGQFHLIVGMLHLFGFHLPETNHHYCLASSFTDVWRRINIYWKDFMLKVFYYPAYFKLRHLGGTKALILATAWVFLISWFFHSYQWFWLRASFPVLWQDGVFWGILACLVIHNSLREASRGRERTLGKTTRTWRSTTALALRVAGTFTTICVLWSIWTTESLTAWLTLWSAIPKLTASLELLPSVLVVGAVLWGGMRHGGAQPPESKLTRLAHLIPRTTLMTLLTLSLLAVFSLPVVYTRLGTTVASAMLALRTSKLSKGDAAKMERGYYENLLEVDRFNGQLWEVYMNRPMHWLDVRASTLEQFSGNFLYRELIPSASMSSRYGVVSTNRWGMRDQDYALVPTPGTYRIAMLGASTIMGWGVEDGKTFEALLEEQLNRAPLSSNYAPYEVLNFGVAGYFPLQQLMVLENKVSRFSVQSMIYTATGREAARSALYLAQALRNGVDIPYDYLRALIQRTGVNGSMAEADIVKRLAPFEQELLVWLYSQMVQYCQQHGIQPLWVFIPAVEEEGWRQQDARALHRTAAETGFTILNIAQVFAHHKPADIHLEDWDKHPNAKGHQLIAQHLYEALRPQAPTLFAPAAPRVNH